jgi:hypothetical protein
MHEVQGHVLFIVKNTVLKMHVTAFASLQKQPERTFEIKSVLQDGRSGIEMVKRSRSARSINGE